jgi:prolycopene isomerase
MDPVDQFHFRGSNPLPCRATSRAFIAKLKEFFPDESARIDLYFKELRQAYLAGLLYYFKGVANDTLDRIEHYTMWEKLNQTFRDPRIKAVLMADSLHWGSLPGTTSYVFDAMLRLAYFLGNYYPKGSSQKFADDLGRGLQSRGGKVLKCMEASRLIIENATVHGVVARTVSKTAPKEFEFRAPVVVANGDALHTYRDLIGERYCGRAILDRLEAMKPSRACFLMHIGLKGEDPQRLAEADGYHWPSFDQSDALRKAFKIFVPTKYDPSIAPPGCQIIITQKLSHVRIAEVKDWPAHKREVEVYVLGRLSEVLPGIEKNIVFYSSASAMTSHRFTGNLDGAMLGWEMSPEQLGPGRPPITTPIQNLYMCGHWTQPGGGITPVIVSAQRAADAVLTGHYDGEEMAAHYFTAGMVAHG